MNPPMGPSTYAFLTMIVVTGASFVATLAEGNPSPWLAAASAGLTALLGVLRTWQAVTAAPKARR